MVFVIFESIHEKKEWGNMLFAKNCVSLKVRSLFDEKKRLPV